MVYVFHDFLCINEGYFEIFVYLEWVLVNDPAYSHCYNDNGVYLSTIELLDEWVMFIEFSPFNMLGIVMTIGEIN